MKIRQAKKMIRRHWNDWKLAGKPKGSFQPKRWKQSSWLKACSTVNVDWLVEQSNKI